MQVCTRDGSAAASANYCIALCTNLESINGGINGDSDCVAHGVTAHSGFMGGSPPPPTPAAGGGMMGAGFMGGGAPTAAPPTAASAGKGGPPTASSAGGGPMGGARAARDHAGASVHRTAPAR